MRAGVSTQVDSDESEAFPQRATPPAKQSPPPESITQSKPRRNQPLEPHQSGRSPKKPSSVARAESLEVQGKPPAPDDCKQVVSSDAESERPLAEMPRAIQSQAPAQSTRRGCWAK